MHINLKPLCIMIIFLLAPPAASQDDAAADSQPVDSTVLELDDSTIDEALARYPFFILDVYEPLCNPCQRMEEAVHELSVELKDQAAFGMINGKNNPLTEERYNVTGYPTLLVFENGTLIDSSSGFASKEYIVGNLRIAKKELNTSRVTFSE